MNRAVLLDVQQRQSEWVPSLNMWLGRFSIELPCCLYCDEDTYSRAFLDDKSYVWVHRLELLPDWFDSVLFYLSSEQLPVDVQ